jgi:hypothetical protein
MLITNGDTTMMIKELRDYYFAFSSSPLLYISNQ